MASPAISAQGITLGISDGIGGFTQITGISTFNGPGGSAAVIDVTDLSSVAKEKRMGVPDEGSLSFTLRYNPAEASHIALRAARSAQTNTSFQLTFTDATNTTWTFFAYVTTFTVQGGVDAVVEANVTLEINGEITENTPAAV